MNTAPFFSIVLPTYNRAAFIAKAISSVLDQSFDDFELIIIDDGSTDNTKHVVDSFADTRIRYIYQENQERSVARNNGIKQAKGNYICFLDSDDYYLNNHLMILYENIKQHNFPIALFHTYQTYVKNEQEQDYTIVDNYFNDKFSESDCRLINNVWLFSPAVQTVAVHKDVFVTIKFDSFPIPFECYDFLGRVAFQFNVFKINERTVIMQMHDGNSTAYDFKFLERSEIAFNYILSNPIYANIKNHFSVRAKMYSIYIGLADYYSRNNNKLLSIKNILKGFGYSIKIKNWRMVFGIIRNVILR